MREEEMHHTTMTMPPSSTPWWGHKAMLMGPRPAPEQWIDPDTLFVAVPLKVMIWDDVEEAAMVGTFRLRENPGADRLVEALAGAQGDEASSLMLTFFINSVQHVLHARAGNATIEELEDGQQALQLTASGRLTRGS